MPKPGHALDKSQVFQFSNFQNVWEPRQEETFNQTYQHGPSNTITWQFMQNKRTDKHCLQG